MTVKNGKILRCTDDELFQFYVDSDWCEIMDYNEYKRRCIENGTAVTDG